MLQNRGTPHLLRNKVSDKFERRDVQFYDLYVKKDAKEDVARLRDSGYQMDIGAAQYYQDIEVDDFNRLFRHEKYTADKFGSTIKVTLDVSSGTKGSRFVRENQELVKMKDDSNNSPSNL
jgi:N-acetyl-anhydromuramyl-L-alanine amidase AmpD